MFKFLNYELKRSAKFIVQSFFISLIISFIFMFMNIINEHEKMAIKHDDLMLTAVLITIFCVMAINLLYFLSRYRKDIFSKSSYLTFTLDVKASSIFLSKIICALLIFILNEIVFVCVFYFINSLVSYETIELFRRIDFVRIFQIGLMIISLYYLVIFLLLSLAISLSRVKFFNRYYDFVTIVLYVVLFTLFSAFLRYVYVKMPYMLSFDPINITKVGIINGIDLTMLYMGVDGTISGINILMPAFSFLIILLSFIHNMILIENKIDL